MIIIDVNLEVWSSRSISGWPLDHILWEDILLFLGAMRFVA
jgi:hypothetical protein